MKFICDAPDGKTWFRIETEVEANRESVLMGHAVEKHFLREKAAAEKAFAPASTSYIESNIGLAPHIQRTMPLFLTLRKGWRRLGQVLGLQSLGLVMGIPDCLHRAANPSSPENLSTAMRGDK